MKHVITDWDGMIVDSERARAIGWVMAFSYTMGVDNTKFAVHAIREGSSDAKKYIDGFIRDHEAEIDKAMTFGGPTTNVVAGRVYGHMRYDNSEWIPGKDAHQFRGKFLNTRKEIRDPLLKMYSTPIEENIRFFEALYHAMLLEHDDPNPLAIVTSQSMDVICRWFEHGDRRGWWNADFSDMFNRDIIRGETHYHMVSSGDDLMNQDPDSAQKLAEGYSYKADAYRNICPRLGIRPEETITFEDTDAGISAAREAGIGGVIGVRGDGNPHGMKGADVIISPNLEAYVAAIPIIASGTPEEAVEAFMHCNNAQVAGLEGGDPLGSNPFRNNPPIL